MSASTHLSGTPEVSLAYAARMLPEHDYDVLLEVQVDWTERRLRVRGELDIATNGILAEAIALLSGSTAEGDIAIQMQGVTFIDASGIGVLVQAARRLETSGRVLRLDGCTGMPRDLLTVTGAAAVLLPDNASPGS